jgi:SPP1 gp7 family putative phage head morphogenesis protein
VIKNNPDQKTLRPVIANVGIEAEYRKRLKRMIADMQASIVYWLSAKYKANEPLIAQDDWKTPSNALQDAMDDLARQWQSNFDVGAEKLAEWFANKTKSYADGSLQRILKDAGFSVDFKMTPTMQDAFEAVIHENVGLIKSIASQHLQDVQGLVMRSVQQGRNLGELSDELIKRYGVTKRRAALIAKQENNKATMVINRVRQLEIGVKEGVWRHSRAGVHPRASHIAASGKVFDIDKGMKIDGDYIMPGELFHCRCTWTAIIPGFKS